MGSDQTSRIESLFARRSFGTSKGRRIPKTRRSSVECFDQVARGSDTKTRIRSDRTPTEPCRSKGIWDHGVRRELGGGPSFEYHRFLDGRIVSARAGLCRRRRGPTSALRNRSRKRPSCGRNRSFAQGRSQTAQTVRCADRRKSAHGRQKGPSRSFIGRCATWKGRPHSLWARYRRARPGKHGRRSMDNTTPVAGIMFFSLSISSGR